MCVTPMMCQTHLHTCCCAQIENQRNDEADKAGKALEARKAANANLKRLTKEQSSLETRQKAAQDLLSGTIEQRRELTTRIAELECEIQDIKDKSKQDENDQVDPFYSSSSWPSHISRTSCSCMMPSQLIWHMHFVLLPRETSDK